MGKRLKPEVIGLLFLLYAENGIWLCNAPLDYAIKANLINVLLYFIGVSLIKRSQKNISNSQGSEDTN